MIKSMTELAQAIENGHEIEIEVRLMDPFHWEIFNPSSYIYSNLEDFIRQDRLRIAPENQIRAVALYCVKDDTITNCYRGVQHSVISNFFKDMQQQLKRPMGIRWGRLFDLDTGKELAEFDNNGESD